MITHHHTMMAVRHVGRVQEVLQQYVVRQWDVPLEPRRLDLIALWEQQLRRWPIRAAATVVAAVGIHPQQPMPHRHGVALDAGPVAAAGGAVGLWVTQLRDAGAAA